MARPIMAPRWRSRSSFQCFVLNRPRATAAWAFVQPQAVLTADDVFALLPHPRQPPTGTADAALANGESGVSTTGTEDATILLNPALSVAPGRGIDVVAFNPGPCRPLRPEDLAVLDVVACVHSLRSAAAPRRSLPSVPPACRVQIGATSIPANCPYALIIRSHFPKRNNWWKPL